MEVASAPLTLCVLGKCFPSKCCPWHQQDFASFSYTFEKAPKPSVVGMSEEFTQSCRNDRSKPLLAKK